ncbi:putative aminopeptidase npepl1 [Massospora cicadina]|nr:putative aminopeptidase npepl1 [Massospora cicadina]
MVKEMTIEVGFVSANGQPLDNVNIEEIQCAADAIRLASRLTDTPCSELHTEAYISEIQKAVSELPQPSLVEIKIINGHDLEVNGFGGLWGVGKAAVHLPALVVLTYTPSSPADKPKNIALVGKGICFDTGGLSLKSTTSMPTMKGDMGGSAATLGAFLASVRLQTPHKLHAVLCLAENSVDQLSMRPDDIITLYSGKTVEVNNTDAEGRLILGDGVAYASHDLTGVSHIIDMATLTGAQLITTGPRHAGFMVNKAAFESQVIEAAYSSGDLVYPLIYCPEFFMKDLESEVADMKNSNKNGPTTAASSLAGHFIEAHHIQTLTAFGAILILVNNYGILC